METDTHLKGALLDSIHEGKMDMLLVQEVRDEVEKTLPSLETAEDPPLPVPRHLAVWRTPLPEIRLRSA
eukprot:9014451-Alexandrium_andersonii.AAC.1